jgi:hypothetical protein
MALKRLISFDDITSRTAVALGGEAHKFDIAIPKAEREHLRPVLGYALFDELLNFVQQATPDTTDPLAQLAEQVKDMLAAWAVVEAWPFLLVHLEAAGLTIKVGNKADGTSSADVALADRTLAAQHSMALFHSAELSTWLLKNAATYPTWEKPGGAPSTEMPLGGLDLD